MSLPLLISLPHAGRVVPPEVQSRCCLTNAQLIRDGDEGAEQIYDFAEEVAVFVTTDIPRAIVDVNRAPDDRRADGVVKSHTIYNEPVYNEALSEQIAEALLRRYYYPYHQQLTRAARSGVILGIDCHTMAAVGPPIGPDTGQQRPHICLSNGEGTCPAEWLACLAVCLGDSFGAPVSVNHPFKGGHIIRAHAAELPWVQLELSRADFLPLVQKRTCVLAALRAWCDRRPAI